MAEAVLRAPGQWRLVPTRANGSPALAVYERGPGDTYRAYGISALTLVGGRIARMVVFFDPILPARFGLPEVLTAPPTQPSGSWT
jgi:RNA polymerase sigma-70 factor (ECF subfamily)